MIGSAPSAFFRLGILMNGCAKAGDAFLQTYDRPITRRAIAREANLQKHQRRDSIPVTDARPEARQTYGIDGTDKLI